MENEKRTNEELPVPGKAFQLLSWARQGQDITARDDQYEFPTFLDAIKICRKKGFRFRLIDSGTLMLSQLEWLVEAGADLYTSDEARNNFFELELLNKACRRNGTILAYFHHGPFEPRVEEELGSFSALQGLARSGAYFYLADRERERDLQRLNELAAACRQGGSWLVHYHFGPLELPLDELAKNKVWFHFLDQKFKEIEDRDQALDRMKSALSRGLKLILHVEKVLDYSSLEELMKAGAFILFKSSLIDYRSPFKALEEKARQRKLDFRAYYLYPDFLP